MAKQISVFLENKSGALDTVLCILKKNNIQLIASTIADTAEYGIFRIVCDRPDDAFEALKAGGTAVSLCDVYAIDLDDKPGSAAEVIYAFASNGVGISYLYSFLFGGRGVLIFKTDNPEKADEVIKENGFSTKVL